MPAISRCIFLLVVTGTWPCFAQQTQQTQQTQPTQQDVAPPVPAGNVEVEKIMRSFAGRGVLADGSKPLAPEDTIQHFRPAADVKVELVAAEPTIAQPLFLNFDERGRMWVVQYRQYPFPAGLKVVHYDQHLRAVFDKVPPPPPDHFVGQDRISVLEDLDGNGSYETHRDVITGLSIATSVVTGAGGIWVLNPPYLLFYPDADADAVPDGDPEVHLSGFGLEDTHSVANSLRWGPDGWLYAANGSTTTAKVRTRDGKELAFQGQCIWRYHPRHEVFEIYAEGGGNTFSTEVDSVGRIFSGTNHGNTRGMYYPQGSYGEKNWGKHGPLTNPYAFGYFLHMRSQGDSDRFAQTFAIYEADNLPAVYRGNIISANALHNRVWASKLLRDASSYRTEDLPPVLETEDRWFRPVDVKVGPDGAVYLADWYDSRLTHVDPRDDWHKSSGRIYRITAAESESDGVESAWSKVLPCSTQFDLTKLTSDQLVELLDHPNKFFRHTAVRVLGERNDPMVTNRLKDIARQQNHPRSLEALWVLNGMRSIDEPLAIELLKHTDEHVRRWTVRLLGDEAPMSTAFSSEIAGALTTLAARETDIQVRTQLASTAKRLPAKPAIEVVKKLLEHEGDATDIHQPLLIWWAVEAHCENDRDTVLEWLQDPKAWKNTIVRKTLLERLMQRFAMSGRQADWETCTKLMKLAPSLGDQEPLATGMREALAGRKVVGLPAELSEQIANYQASSQQSDLPLRLRTGDRAAIAAALKAISSRNTNKSERIELVEVVGEVRAAGAVAPLLQVLAEGSSHSLQRVTLQALAGYDDPSIGAKICQLLQSSLPREHDLQHTALRVLASRPIWSGQLLDEVEMYRLKSEMVPMDVVQQMRLHDDKLLQDRLLKLWGQVQPTPAQRLAEIAGVREILRGGTGDYHAGRELFKQKCGVCHTMFGEGGKTGPDLTGYERDNLEFMLLSIIDPSAAIREEFTNYQILTGDGRVLTGLIEKQDTQTVTLRGVDNQTTLVSRDNIEKLQAVRQSLMPEEILKGLSEQQIRDLMRFVTTRVPVK